MSRYSYVSGDEVRNLSEMNKEELLAVAEYLASSLETYQRPGMAQAIGIGKAEMLRRGL